uniref:NADH-quinone oxidoreductase subunit A n=1 Tax=Candidatus Methanomethylicus mesodigestus TaxID=1867258 RepID=A0A7C3ISV8_9CREN
MPKASAEIRCHMLAELLSNPLFAFIAALLTVLALFLIANPRTRPNEEKAMPYVCGEKGDAERTPVSIHIFEFAFAFLVLDVIAVLLIFSYNAPSPALPLAYLALAALALYSFPVLRRRR